MVATALFLHLRPHRHRRLILHNAISSLQFSSSSSSSNSDDNDQNRTSQSQSQSQSYFSDVKASLKQTAQSTQQPRRPSFFNSPPGTREDPTQKVASLEEIRKNLSEFRRRPSVQPPQSSTPVISFQELYKRNVMPKADTGSASENAVKREPTSLEAIRMSLKQRPSLSQSLQPEDARRRSPLDGIGLNLNLRPNTLKDVPSTMLESTGKDSKGVVSDETKTEFVRMYSYGDLGEKLRKLRPGNKKSKFSLSELNERLRMLREMEDMEMKNSGMPFKHLRESLLKLHDEDKTKKNAAQRISLLGHFGGTPSFKSHPPNEVLVEKYFHPDHMSSAEKQKLELKNVRNKFKVSESDCGSARVQVAQLTTKIKHLATVLHKKDKHSRKGLQAMVQKRKKLLKYLRRKDWDSYCFCLSELGLRDSADYKA